MKFVIENRALIRALEHVCDVVERKNTIPILANVLLDVAHGKLTVTGTNLDIELSESVPAAVEAGGRVTVGALLLCSIIKKMPAGGQTMFRLEKAMGGTMHISCGRSKFELATLPQEDFPSFATHGLAHEFTMDAGAFRRMVNTVRMSMSTEQTRYYLNGFYLHEMEGRLISVSTDGHRLTKYQTDLPEGADGMPGIIVPRQTALALSSLLDGVEGDLQVRMSDTKMTVSFGDTEFKSKLIDGTFPPYDRVIPTGNANILQIGKSDIADAVGRLSVIHSMRGSPIKIALSAPRGAVPSLNLSARNTSDGAGGDEDMGEADYSGQPLEIGFNAKYLAELLGQVDTDEVRFLFGDAGSPAVIEPVGDAGTLFVLMPLRV